MRTHTRTEIAVGAFVLAGAMALAYLATAFGGSDLLFAGPEYAVVARFAGIGDLKQGSPVKVAGVKVGRVARIELADYRAEIVLEIDEELALPTDTIASVRTAGVLGESYVLLTPGASEKNLANGGRISRTEPAVDLIQLIVEYALKPGLQGADLETEPPKNGDSGGME